jgi:outer membrane receptor protein involved in Fe transport
LGNINEARYKGMELQLKRRLSRKWQMDASYTYGRSIGAAEEFDQDLGDDPATVASEFSYLSDDERHIVKTNFSVFLPRDWQLGWTALWSSGRPYSVISQFTASDNYDFQQFRTIFGDYPGGEGLRILKRNTRRNNPYYLIDVKAEKALVLGKFNSKLFLNVDNLLNTDVLYIEAFEPAASNKSLNLQLDAERLFGRRFEIGMALEF